jgi:hypothetical protein
MTLDSGAGHRIWQRLRRFLDWTMSPSTDLKQETKTEDSADRALITGALTMKFLWWRTTFSRVRPR